MTTELMDAPPVDSNRKKRVIPRGATEGPLKTLIPVFIDVETLLTDEITLKKMTFRQYLKASRLTMMAVAIGDEPTQIFEFDNEGDLLPDHAWIADVLAMLAKDPRYVFVGHNAAFDMRVLRFLLGMPQPINVWCTVEGAMGSWPELPGGFSLEAIPISLNFPKELQKIVDIDLREGYHTDDEKRVYNIRDVDVMREIYYRQIARLPAVEQEVALRTHRQRQFWFKVDQQKLSALIETLDKNAEYAEKEAERYIVDPDNENMTDEQKQQYIRDIFNRDEGYLRSVRSRRLLGIVQDKMKGGEAINTTSFKKLSPVIAAQFPNIASLIKEASRVNKMLSHKRRSVVFRDVDQVDVELGYMRAHTGRFSSPSVGKGLNLHNIPKHDISIAKPVRQTFRLPPDKCFVRADLANIEYRVEGWLTDCRTVINMFDPLKGGNIFNDPYCLSWKAMTNQEIDKKNPVRQVAKAAVLGLGFCMSATGYAKVLLVVLADPNSKITPAVLQSIVLEQGWTPPNGNALRRIMQDLGCTQLVALVAFHIHRLFNEAHPEFSRVAEWLVRCVTTIGRCGMSLDLSRKLLDKMHDSNYAPDRNKIELSIDNDDSRDWASVRVKCGPWAPTVCWREPKFRPVDYNNMRMGLTIRKANGPPKMFTRQLAIENVTQAAARNGLCWGIAELDKRDQPYVLHVHDEALLIVDRKREAILKARDDLMTVFGPKGYSPMGWAVLMKPEEVTVTESMYEDEVDIQPPTEKNKMMGYDRWRKIEENAPDALLALP